MTEHHKPFYDVEILRNEEQAYIQSILKKYRGETANEALKEKIWNELQQEKYLGRLRIPFKVTLKKDPTHTFADCVEVTLDTKV